MERKRKMQCQKAERNRKNISWKRNDTEKKLEKPTSQTQFRTSTANVEQLRLLKHCNKRASTR